MPIDYRFNQPISVEQFIDLCQSAGLNRPLDDHARVQRMLDNANLTLTAWHGDTLIGIARSLTDYGFCCYLSDLAVRKEHQHTGIGKELIRRTQAHVGDDCTLMLIAAPAANTYYPRIGFEKIERAWMIERKR